MDELWNAWAAGFVDGEGAVMLMRGTGQVYIAVRVAQVVRAPLDRLVMMYGGKVKEVSKTNCRNGFIYEWHIYGKNALVALRKMRPFMMVKGAHVDLIEEYYEKCFGVDTPFEQRLEFVSRMRTVNRKAENRVGTKGY